MIWRASYDWQKPATALVGSCDGIGGAVSLAWTCRELKQKRKGKRFFCVCVSKPGGIVTVCIDWNFPALARVPWFSAAMRSLLPLRVTVRKQSL